MVSCCTTTVCTGCPTGASLISIVTFAGDTPTFDSATPQGALAGSLIASC